MWKTYNWLKCVCVFFLRFYFFIHERHREREAETQAEGEAGSSQGARCGTWSQDSGNMPWAEGRRSTTEPPRRPPPFFLCFFFLRFYLFIHDRQREAETQAEGEAGSMQGADAGLDPGTPDHALGWRQELNRWAPQESPLPSFFSFFLSTVVIKSIHFRATLPEFASSF